MTIPQPRSAAHPGSTVLISAADREEIRTRLRSDVEEFERRLAALDTDAMPDQLEARRLRQALDEVSSALLQLDEPEYGYCTECGRWIAIARLLALPHTRHCIECASVLG